MTIEKENESELPKDTIPLVEILKEAYWEYPLMFFGILLLIMSALMTFKQESETILRGIIIYLESLEISTVVGFVGLFLFLSGFILMIYRRNK